MKFTPIEESIILSCIANGIPLCCSPPTLPRPADKEADRKRRMQEGDAIVEAIIPNSPQLREMLREFAYEGLGCAYDIADHPDTWDRYFEKTVEFLCDERLHLYGAPVVLVDRHDS